MNYAIRHAPVFPILEFEMNEGDQVWAQPNTLLALSAGIRLSARVGRQGSSGRWSSGLKNLLGGESFFTTEFVSKRDGQHLTLAPDAMGDIVPLDLALHESMFLTRGSYLANIGNVDLTVKYGGMKGVLSQKGLFLLQARGTGVVFCQAYGAIEQRELATDEVLIVDNRYVVAFSESITYQLVKATESVTGSLMSGEGLVNRYHGPGRIIYQTRPKPSFGLLGTLFRSLT